MTQALLDDAALLDEIERLYEVQDGILGFIGLPTFEDLMRLARAGLRVPALEEDVERLTEEAAEQHRRFRWNIEEDESALMICFGGHETGEPCTYVRFVRAESKEDPTHG